MSTILPLPKGVMHALHWLVTATFFLVLMPVAGAAESARVSAVDLTVRAGKVTLSAPNASRQRVLQALADAVDARLTIRGPLPAAPRGWALRNVAVADAVVRIARPWNVLIVPGGAHGVREIYVFGAQSSATRIQRRPLATPLTGRRVDVWQSPPAPDAETMARRDAVAALGSEPGAASVPALNGALSDPDVGVRLEALRALGRLDTDEAIRIVGQVAMGAGSAAERAAAQAVLEASRSELAAVMLSLSRSRAPGFHRPGD